jgi:hypothetical protein
LRQGRPATRRAVAAPPSAAPAQPLPARRHPHLPQEEEETLDRLVERWLLSRGASLEQQVAALRLLAAALDAWLFQWPLTEENMMEKLVSRCPGQHGCCSGPRPRRTCRRSW